jgi:hypothetical protein
MRKAIDYLRAHPIIAVAIVVGLVGVIALWPRSQPTSQPTTQAPLTPTTPAPAAPPAGAPSAVPAAPAPQPAPAGQPAAAPSPRTGSAAVNAGRPDPFSALVRPAGSGGGGGAPVPPPAPLPPPLFPGQQPGQPGAPQPGATPAPPPKEASTAQLVGILGDNGSVAIIKLGGKTYIVSPGDVISDKIKVSIIDVGKGLVILEEEGERFEIKLGGVSGGHVAASAPSRFS